MCLALRRSQVRLRHIFVHFHRCCVACKVILSPLVVASQVFNCVLLLSVSGVLVLGGVGRPSPIFVVFVM